MFVTEFLEPTDYKLYGQWLAEQDAGTREMYFGVAAGTGVVDSLMGRIEANPDRHKFLVARNCTAWLGVLHIAEIDPTSVEFGIIVKQELRGEGIGGSLIDEALTWCRNRGYRDLFMHCLERNHVIRHLCEKYGLEPRSQSGESEVKIKLLPPSFISLNKEISIKQRNMFHRFLQTTTAPFQETYG